MTAIIWILKEFAYYYQLTAWMLTKSQENVFNAKKSIILTQMEIANLWAPFLMIIVLIMNI